MSTFLPSITEGSLFCQSHAMGRAGLKPQVPGALPPIAAGHFLRLRLERSETALATITISIDYRRSGGKVGFGRRCVPDPNMETIRSRIGFWGLLYYNHSKDPHNSFGKC